MLPAPGPGISLCLSAFGCDDTTSVAEQRRPLGHPWPGWESPWPTLLCPSYWDFLYFPELKKCPSCKFVLFSFPQPV